MPPRGFHERSASQRYFRISPDTYRYIDEWIDAAEVSGRNAQLGINAMVNLLARTNQAIAMRMSAGPVDPQMRNPQAAWKTPVRRITSRYYKGWKVRRLAPGLVILYNDTREAYFIEFGINHVGQGFEVTYRDGRTYIKGSRRVRRPIRKLSLIKTLQYADQTKAGERIWEMMFAPFRPGRVYRGRGSMLANDMVQALPGMRFI